MDSHLKLWVIVFTALSSVACANTQLPAQAYGRLPAFFDAAISPDGKHLALGWNDDTGEQYLQIIDLATGKTVAGVKHRPTAYDQDKAVMREAGWADNRRAT